MQTVSAADKPAGTPIFDGKTLKGWKVLGGGADYKVVDGAIVGSSRPGVPNSFLVTEKDYTRLHPRIRRAPGRRARRTRACSSARLSTPDFENGRVHGYQTDIDPSDRAVERRHLRRSAARLVLHRRDESAGASAVQVRRVEPLPHRGHRAAPARVDQRRAGRGRDRRREARRVSSACRCIRSTRPKRPGAPRRWKNLRVQTKNLKPLPPMGIFIRNNLPNNLDADEKAQGWRLLWDGKTARRLARRRCGGFPGEGLVAGEWRAGRASRRAAAATS